MKRYPTLAAILTTAVAMSGLGPATARAETARLCGDHASVAEALARAYAEKRVAIGLSNGGAVVEVYASPSGSFSIVMTQPSGLACLLTAGENWESIPRALSDLKT